MKKLFTTLFIILTMSFVSDLFAQSNSSYSIRSASEVAKMIEIRSGLRNIPVRKLTPINERYIIQNSAFDWFGLAQSNNEALDAVGFDIDHIQSHWGNPSSGQATSIWDSIRIRDEWYYGIMYCPQGYLNADFYQSWDDVEMSSPDSTQIAAIFNGWKTYATGSTINFVIDSIKSLRGEYWRIGLRHPGANLIRILSDDGGVTGGTPTTVINYTSNFISAGGSPVYYGDVMIQNNDTIQHTIRLYDFNMAMRHPKNWCEDDSFWVPACTVNCIIGRESSKEYRGVWFTHVDIDEAAETQGVEIMVNGYRYVPD